MIAGAVIGSAVIGAAASDSASRRGARAQRTAAQQAAEQAEADRAAALQDREMQIMLAREGMASNASLHHASLRQAMQMYQQGRTDQMPWMDAGNAALKQINRGLKKGGDFNRDFTLADFQAEPGYEFRRTEGLRGIEQSAAARGGALSGNTLRALNDFNSNIASDEFGNAYSRWNSDRDRRFARLSNVSSQGQSAAAGVGSMGMQAAGMMVNANGQMMDANSAGTGQMLGAISDNAADRRITGQAMRDSIIDQGNIRASRYQSQANSFNQALGSISNYYTGQQYMNQFAGGGGGGASTYSGNPMAYYG